MRVKVAARSLPFQVWGYTIFWKEYYLFISLSLQICQKLVDCVCSGLFLVSVFFSIHQYIYYFANTTLS